MGHASFNEKLMRFYCHLFMPKLDRSNSNFKLLLSAIEYEQQVQTKDVYWHLQDYRTLI